jgi:hypothetical protein
MNIVLLNYMIAILSTTYEKIKFSGTFRYKVNLYMYCERFMKAFLADSYGEVVKHPPPLSCFTIPIIPFLFMSKKSKIPKKVM